jgi:hypothetical protein
MVTLAELQGFILTLCEEEEYDPHEGVWTFRSGGSCSRCTDSAVKVVRAFGGRMIGYYASDNPTAAIGEPHCDGHDFAIVADRFVVDYWAYRVVGAVDRPVFDLSEPSDAALVNQFYGSKETWEVFEVEDGNSFRSATT